MGLDMYLEAVLYLGNSDKKEKQQNVKIRKMFPEMIKTDNLNYVNVVHEVGYWRKANQIHKWFVDNVQDGQDNCGYYYVSRENLKELLELCKEVLKHSVLIDGKVVNGYKGTERGFIPNIENGKIVINPTKAMELLPTMNGCFFGSMDYDQWYISDIENTVKMIKRCLKLPDSWKFQYHSSW